MPDADPMKDAFIRWAHGALIPRAGHTHTHYTHTHTHTYSHTYTHTHTHLHTHTHTLHTHTRASTIVSDSRGLCCRERHALQHALHYSTHCTIARTALQHALHYSTHCTTARTARSTIIRARKIFIHFLCNEYLWIIEWVSPVVPLQSIAVRDMWEKCQWIP